VLYALDQSVVASSKQIESMPKITDLDLQRLRTPLPAQLGAALSRAGALLAAGQGPSAPRALSPRGRYKRTCAF
jgi:hypothetical protein